MADNHPILIIIADDHSIFRKGLSLILSKNPIFEIVAEACNGYEALKMIETIYPDILITDIAMPGIDGIELSTRVKNKFPSIGVIGISQYDDDYLIKKVFEAGADSYLLKNSELEDLTAAITCVFNGENYVPKNISEKVFRLQLEATYKPSTVGLLSQREIDVIKLICAECSTKEIAEKLQISTRTVDDHRSHIIQKTGAKNLAGIVVFAVKNGII